MNKPRLEVVDGEDFIEAFEERRSLGVTPYTRSNKKIILDAYDIGEGILEYCDWGSLKKGYETIREHFRGQGILFVLIHKSEGRRDGDIDPVYSFWRSCGFEEFRKGILIDRL